MRFHDLLPRCRFVSKSSVNGDSVEQPNRSEQLTVSHTLIIAMSTIEHQFSLVDAHFQFMVLAYVRTENSYVPTIGLQLQTFVRQARAVNIVR